MAILPSAEPALKSKLAYTPFESVVFCISKPVPAAPPANPSPVATVVSLLAKFTWVLLVGVEVPTPTLPSGFTTNL